MKAFYRRSLFVLASLPIAASFFAASASAQWINVAPNLVRGADFAGAMQFRDGIVWAGANALWSSTDSGTSWRPSSAFPYSSIKDIAFLDRKIGLVATDDGVLQTTDGGIHWTNTISSGHFSKVGFDGTGSEEYALSVDGIFYASSNGGATWNRTNLGDESRSFAVAIDGTVYVTVSHPSKTPYLAEVHASLDHGAIWQTGGASTQGDCYTLAVDSCDPNRLYLVNENIQSPSDNTARIYLSTDGGASWQTVQSRPVPYYSGSMCTTANAVFLGTVNAAGVLRSIDKGLTWKSIGGPADSTDTRNLAAINANIVFAIDPSGSIWRTTNGGGDSVGTGSSDFVYSESPQRLFSADTLNLCDTARLDTVEIDASACLWPNVKSERILGPAANDYGIMQHVSAPFSAYDSATISFTPSDTGLRLATYEVTMDDGTVISIPLAGFGEVSHVLSLASSSVKEKTDTIGGEVAVPITINGLARAETVELVLHYPLADLVYDGSFDPAGTNVDIPGEQWPGRSKLRIMGATSGAVAAYARFKVFSDTAYNPQITFDSLNVPTALTPCEYLLPPAVTSEIFPLQGCGIQMLSRWVHLGIKPLFGIRPNPTSGAISITSSMNVGDVSIEVYDMLGMERAQFHANLSKEVPATLSLPLKNGTYYVRVISRAGEASYPIVIEK